MNSDSRHVRDEQPEEEPKALVRIGQGTYERQLVDVRGQLKWQWTQPLKKEDTNE